MGGGTPIVMGGSSQSELQAQLERSALENEQMLSRAADEQLRLQSELDSKDQEMSLLLEQQASETEQNLARAQEALNIEVDALDAEADKDDLEVDFSALEKALATGMGLGDTGARPL